MRNTDWKNLLKIFMLKNQTITITNSDKKWTSIKYGCSTAKGRVNTSKLVKLFTENKLNITNPSKLISTGERNHVSAK